MKIKIKQSLGFPSQSQADKATHIILLVAEPLRPRAWSALPYGELLRRRLARPGAAGAKPQLTELPNEAGTRVAIARVKGDASAFDLLTVGRRLAQMQLAQDPKEVLLVPLGFSDEEAMGAAKAAIAALLAGAHAMPTFKSTQERPKRLGTVRAFGLPRRIDFARTLAEAEGNNLARYLTALPPNQLTPRQYLSWVSALAKSHGWRLRFYDHNALRRKKAGAFLAVAQGSAEPEAGIIHLRYTPPGRSRRPLLALVGKGICYDTGGLNLKPARHMLGMHGDMAGSAVALGTLLALSRLEVDFPVDCWLALAQNQIGPSAYRQNDVVTAANGTSIEVVHTDAEGRMVLADTLVLAGRNKPGLVLDYATLTGSCVEALGTTYSGAFSNRDELVPELIAAGRDSGERVWPFPTDADYDEPLESDIADVKQCILESEADHILAARFLGRFVEPSVPWVHLDLAAANHKGGLGHVPTDVTGFGVRFTLNLLLDRKVL